ncbi:MAG: thiamine ABC transporter substrate-binding protein [Candidatus Micrarchaeota archaeon]
MRLPAAFAAAIVFLLLSGCVSDGDPRIGTVERELVVYTYDGLTSEWGLGPRIFPLFEAECGCRVKTVAPGDVGSMMSRLIAEKASPQADVALGIDNTFRPAAVANDLFAPYEPANAGSVGEALVDGDFRFIPFDWGYLAFVYDSEKISNPPQSLDDLLQPEFRGKFAIEDARTSSPGKVFLYWVAAEKGSSTRDYLIALKRQVLTVTPGWSEAYNLFTSGEVPMVLSYSTSPAYHEINENTTKYRAAVFKRLPRQIEYVSVVKGAPHPELAREFAEFMLSPAAQREIPLGNYMYPASTSTELPEAFAELPVPEGFVPEPAGADKWLEVWEEVFSP